jgi:mono/diheme cytochrome c family protein
MPTMSRFHAWPACAFALMLSAAAFAAPTAPRREIRPELIYRDYCSVCHGDRGDGRSRVRETLAPPPRSFTEPGARERLPRERMIAAVRDGKPRTAMVGWGTQLTEREIEAVVDYIRAVFMEPQAPVYAGGEERTRAA